MLLRTVLIVMALIVPTSSFLLTPSFRTSSKLLSTPESPEFTGAQAVSALTADVNTVFTSVDIANILPHRYPFALVDKVIEYVPGKSAVGIKSITLNEPQFTGHFPDRPIMPGVMQIEALAQLAGIICLQVSGGEERC